MTAVQVGDIVALGCGAVSIICCAIAAWLEP